MAMQKCPVCEGRGKVDPDFYGPPEEHTNECRSCWGRGIVFCPEPLPQGGPLRLQTNPNPSGFRYLDDDADRWDWWNRRGSARINFDPPFKYTITNSGEI